MRLLMVLFYFSAYMIVIINQLSLYLVAGEPTKGIVFTTLDRTTLSRVSGTSSVDRHETKEIRCQKGTRNSVDRHEQELKQVPEGHKDQRVSGR